MAVRRICFYKSSDRERAAGTTSAVFSVRAMVPKQNYRKANDTPPIMAPLASRFTEVARRIWQPISPQQTILANGGRAPQVQSVSFSKRSPPEHCSILQKQLCQQLRRRLVHMRFGRRDPLVQRREQQPPCSRATAACTIGSARCSKRSGCVLTQLRSCALSRAASTRFKRNCV